MCCFFYRCVRIDGSLIHKDSAYATHGPQTDSRGTFGVLDRRLGAPAVSPTEGRGTFGVQNRVLYCSS